MSGKDKSDFFNEALEGKNIPVLTLDNKWYRLLDELGRESVKDIESSLNELLRRQGKLNTEARDIKRLKKKLVNELMPMVDGSENNEAGDSAADIEQHKKLIEDCNKKLQDYSDELMDLPRDISQVNKELMLKTMSACYDTIQENTKEIDSIEEWVRGIRIELKKRLIYKQEMEQKNHEIYSYMHDIFGADVLNMFDLQYDPEIKHPTIKNDVNSNEEKDT